MVIVLSYIFAAILLVIFYNELMGRRRIGRTQHSTLRLRFPTKHAKVDLNKSQELIERSAELGIPISLEYGVHGFDEHISLHLSTLRKYRKKLIRLVESLWPKIEVVEHGNQDFWLDTNGHVSALNFAQGKSFILPLKSPKKGDFSPFQALILQLSKLKTVNEGVMFQFVIHRAQAREKGKLSQAIEALSQGSFDEFKEFFDSSALLNKDSLNLVEDKASRPLFEVHGRIIIAAPDHARVKEIEEDFKRTLKQTTDLSPSFNHLELKKVVNSKRELQGFYRREEIKKPMLLNSHELSLLVHIVKT